MNFAVDVVAAAPAEDLALVEITATGERHELTFGEVSDRSARLAGTLASAGVGRGDVVMTLIGNRAEWVLAMVACFRLGAVVLPCSEQLRAKDLLLRLEVTHPRLVIADVRNRSELEAAGLDGSCPPVLLVPEPALFASEPAPSVTLGAHDPCLITFTSGTTGEPRAVLHGQRYLGGQRLQATHWLGPHAGELVWCTAGSGWSKSARNAFIAPWLRGAAALVHDARFDPHQRLELLNSERVGVLCMAPTEYRAIAKRAQLEPLPRLRTMVAAGEALNPEVLRAWREATGRDIRDGYGQTETGQLTAMPIGPAARPGSMGLPLPGVALDVRDGEMVVDPATVPTFFLHYLGARAPQGLWHTGDRVSRDEDGYLFFGGRNDDVIISAGYRIGPFEVETALESHAAVAEAAAVAAPHDERGSVVRAVVVLHDGYRPSPALVHDLQDHVKRETAPYKYPRIVDFVQALPRTSSGKVRRGLLREESGLGRPAP